MPLANAARGLPTGVCAQFESGTEAIAEIGQWRGGLRRCLRGCCLRGIRPLSRAIPGDAVGYCGEGVADRRVRPALETGVQTIAKVGRKRR